MFTMFSNTPVPSKLSLTHAARKTSALVEISAVDEGAYKELRIGQLARSVLRRMLEDGLASEYEVESMQKSEYSKQVFDLHYPVLLRTDERDTEQHYYKDPVFIRGERYRICCEWFETAANNDRRYLLKWIESHKGE